MFSNATDFGFDYNGGTGIIVGYVNAFPHHPDAGTPVAPFPHLTHEPTDAALFALVSVDWATPVTTVDLGTGAASETRYDRSGMFGMPTGLTWNLRLVTRHDDGGYTLAQGSYAAGFHTATIPAAVRAEVTGVPATVKIHDFSTH